MSPEDRQRIADLFRVAQGGGTLAEARAQSGLTLGQAARVTGLTRDRLVALELGATPTDAERARLCDVYGVEGFKPPAVVRVCVVPACEAVRPRERLMCEPHWTRLPQTLRDAVMVAWVAWVATPTAACRKSLIDARRVAVAFLQAEGV